MQKKWNEKSDKLNNLLMNVKEWTGEEIPLRKSENDKMLMSVVDEGSFMPRKNKEE